MCTGLELAKYFIYCKKINNKKITEPINIVNISGKGEYSKNKKIYDKLVVISDKYKFDPKAYIFNYVINRHTKITDILNINVLREYANDILIKKEYEKIYKYFIKSIEFAKDFCLKNNIETSREYIKYLIFNNRLAYEFLAGNLSIYFISSIHNIDKLISKMDNLSQETLQIISERYVKYNSDLQDAFMYLRSQKVNTISFLDKRLSEK